MWPLDRASTKEHLRVGRDAIERWQEVDGALTSVANAPLQRDAGERLQVLGAAIEGAFAHTRPVGAVTLLLESVWLPVVLVDTGGALLRAAEVDTLARHRFGLHHGDARDPVSGWELRIEHRPGDRHALAYGLSPGLKRVILASGQAADVTWDAMLPAFSWGWQRLRAARAWSPANGWWVWSEQDRLLVARVTNKRLAGLNSGVLRCDDEPAIVRLIDGEAARLGITALVDPIAVVSWEGRATIQGADTRLTWFDVRGQGEAPSQPHAGYGSARVTT